MPIGVAPAEPCTISMHARRVRVEAAAAVFLNGATAGAIASRNGSDSVTPIPRRTVRREMCFFVRCILSPGSATSFCCDSGGVVDSAHLKRGTLHDAEHERGK